MLIFSYSFPVYIHIEKKKTKGVFLYFSIFFDFVCNLLQLSNNYYLYTHIKKSRGIIKFALNPL